MQTLQDNIKVVTMSAPAVLDQDNSPITGTVIDTYGTEPEKFDGALVIANVGAFDADLTSVKVKIMESDSSDGSGSTLALGGDEATLTAAGQLVFQVQRSKRYLVAVVTMAATSTLDTAPVSIVAVLSNWAAPFPLV